MIFRTLRTVFKLAAAVNELHDEHEQLLAEWASTRQRFETLLRRITMRASMEKPDIEPDRGGLSGTERKTQLRAAARARGLMP